MSLAIFYSLFLFLVWLIGMIRYKGLTMPFKVITWGVFVTFVLSVLSRYFAHAYQNNAPIIHLESITAYIFYSLTFYYLFKSILIKKIIAISIVIFVVLAIIDAAFFQQPWKKEFPTYIYNPTNALYIVFSLLLFKEMLLYPVKVRITRQSPFWFNIGVLLYGSTMFLILALTNYGVEHSEIFSYVTIYLWYFILFAFHIFIGISILMDKKTLALKYD
jgi:hypothetical protein